MNALLHLVRLESSRRAICCRA